MSGITAFPDYLYGFDPFRLEASAGRAGKELAYSPTGSEDSTITTSVGSEAGSPCATGPWTAGERIKRFLKRKVRLAKALKEYRTICIEKRARERPEKLSFTVETVPTDGYPEIRKTIAAWTKQVDELFDVKDLPSADQEKLDAASFILQCIDSDLGIKFYLKRKNKYKNKSLLIAKDASGKIQAMAFISRAYKPVASSLVLDYHIEYLVTSPDNLKLSFQAGCVSGAPTALVEEVVFKSLKHTARRAITLTATSSAVSFYERLGFTIISSSKFVLTKTNMIKFLSLCGGIALASL